MNIRLIGPEEAGRFFTHAIEHFRESNTDGDVIFHPVTDFESWKQEEMTAVYKKSWAKSLDELHWERVWILEEKGQIQGHATLQGGRMPNSFHRVTFSIGLLRPARGKGYGRALTLEVLEWAKAQGTIEWIDLYVFTHNKPALALYRSFGFKEVGTTEDLFRVRGESVSDTHMVLKL